MIRAKVLRKIEVNSSDFVIDIGGGHRPFWRADLVIEKYPFTDSLHRSQPVHFPKVPLIKADAEAIPISDVGCDLLFSSHVIEHLSDPKRFIEEIQRCAKRVYLEFPSRNMELMFAWSFHKWLVEFDDGVIKFYRNDLPQLFGSLFHDEFDAALGAWSDARHNQLNTSIYCRSEELKCEYPNETATEMLLRTSQKGDARVNFAQSSEFPKYSVREVLAFGAQSVLPRSVYQRLSKIGTARTSPRPLNDSVVARLMCMKCRTNSLSRSNGSIVCQCGAEYAQDRGIFDFDVQN